MVTEPRGAEVLDFVSADERTALLALARSARWIFAPHERPTSPNGGDARAVVTADGVMRYALVSPELAAVERHAIALEARGLACFATSAGPALFGARRCSLTARGRELARKFEEEE